MAVRELDKKHEKKIGLFDLIEDVMSKKKYIFNEDTSTAYTPYMVNKALSQHIDTILIANEMNKRPSVTKEMHHDFLFYSVDAKPRYGKWAKKQDQQEDVITYIKDKYKVNNERAMEYIKLLSVTDIEKIELLLKKHKAKK